MWKKCTSILNWKSRLLKDFAKDATITHSSIKGHFWANFLDLFLKIFLIAFKNVDCICFYYRPKLCTMISNNKYMQYFNMLQNFIQNVRKTKSDFYLELSFWSVFTAD